MINLILQRKPRRIILDRLYFTNDQNKEIFTNNPDIIKKQAIKHYQSHASSNDDNTYTTFQQIGKILYNPDKQPIDVNWWSDLNQEIINVEDVTNIFPKLSKNKASGITCKNLIHLDNYVLDIFKIFSTNVWIYE